MPLKPTRRKWSLLQILLLLWYILAGFSLLYEFVIKHLIKDK